jgi:hypothetical protein
LAIGIAVVSAGVIAAVGTGVFFVQKHLKQRAAKANTALDTPLNVQSTSK